MDHKKHHKRHHKRHRKRHRKRPCFLAGFEKERLLVQLFYGSTRCQQDFIQLIVIRKEGGLQLKRENPPPGTMGFACHQVATVRTMAGSKTRRNPPP